ncbi:MAG: hypothetical protein RR478_03330 [Bacilli bacterium]
MYKLKNLQIFEFINKNRLAKKIGAGASTMSLIFKGKGCDKKTAYAITKCLDGNKEIEDYFIREV